MLSNRETNSLFIGTVQCNLNQMYKAFVMRLSARIPFVQSFGEPKGLVASGPTPGNYTKKKKGKNLPKEVATENEAQSYIAEHW